MKTLFARWWMHRHFMHDESRALRRRIGENRRRGGPCYRGRAYLLGVGWKTD